ncbi:MAG: CvpA family protein [Firmicutes bacterium]|nr:CvpA family protein [Bacillota bacterium]
MNIVDIIIIIFLAFGALIGFRRGFTKQLISSIGLLAVVILAFIFKNPVSTLLYENLPFFKFGGIFKGVTVLNILIYEVIAFFLVLAILMIILKILLFISGIFERFLNMTILLGIPSKILGAVLGILENFIIAFIVLYILTLPIFNIKGLEDSKIKNTILKKTPILSTQIDKSIKVIDEFVELKNKYETAVDPVGFNLEALDLLLEYKITTVSSVEKLLEQDKLQMTGVDEILEKYREG